MDGSDSSDAPADHARSRLIGPCARLRMAMALSVLSVAGCGLLTEDVATRWNPPASGCRTSRAIRRPGGLVARSAASSTLGPRDRDSTGRDAVDVASCGDRDRMDAVLPGLVRARGLDSLLRATTIGDRRSACRTATPRIQPTARTGARSSARCRRWSLPESVVRARVTGTTSATCEIGVPADRYLTRKPRRTSTKPTTRSRPARCAWRRRIFIATEAPVGDVSRAPPRHAS